MVDMGGEYIVISDASGRRHGFVGKVNNIHINNPLFLEEGDNCAEALDLYQQCLGSLLILLADEPQGRRRELLHGEIQNLMNRAEYLKEQLKIRETQQDAISMDRDHFSESVKGSCLLQ
ncbi:serine/threonine-protein kinase ULK3-like [Protopterus annectens]|uniref:serine/threonine-protein kinase ULK3-like n=1 Tax=Protopterus annectens TaxID=7888 RepID=UPI001CF9B875|nr:serine/threonine-protein kinase ULK3-like [Protopterus annectens]